MLGRGAVDDAVIPGWPVGGPAGITLAQVCGSARGSGVTPGIPVECALGPFLTECWLDEGSPAELGLQVPKGFSILRPAAQRISVENVTFVLLVLGVNDPIIVEAGYTVEPVHDDTAFNSE